MPAAGPYTAGMADPQGGEGASAIDAETIKRAMKAFRKRLKLTRLDDESRLGGRYTSAGRHSQIVGILPPHDYPREVWAELVRQGRLRDAGNGFYELAE